MYVVLSFLLYGFVISQNKFDELPKSTTKLALKEIDSSTKRNPIGKISALLELRKLEVSGKIIVSSKEFNELSKLLTGTVHNDKIELYVPVSKIIKN